MKFFTLFESDKNLGKWVASSVEANDKNEAEWIISALPNMSSFHGIYTFPELKTVLKELLEKNNAHGDSVYYGLKSYLNQKEDSEVWEIMDIEAQNAKSYKPEHLYDYFNINECKAIFDALKEGITPLAQPKRFVFDDNHLVSKNAVFLSMEDLRELALRENSQEILQELEKYDCDGDTIESIMNNAKEPMNNFIQVARMSDGVAFLNKKFLMENFSNEKTLMTTLMNDLAFKYIAYDTPFQYDEVSKLRPASFPPLQFSSTEGYNSPVPHMPYETLKEACDADYLEYFYDVAFATCTMAEKELNTSINPNQTYIATIDFVLDEMQKMPQYSEALERARGIISTCLDINNDSIQASRHLKP